MGACAECSYPVPSLTGLPEDRPYCSVQCTPEAERLPIHGSGKPAPEGEEVWIDSEEIRKSSESLYRNPKPEHEYAGYTIGSQVRITRKHAPTDHQATGVEPLTENVFSPDTP